MQFEAANEQANKEETPVRAPLNPAMKRRIFTIVAPLVIFVLAFLLRYLYNAVFMEHRIAHFGDAYNFLRSGSCLLEAIVSSHNPAEFVQKIYQAHPQEQLLQSMTSLKLTDRLLIDGPVYPAYLAAIEWLSGVNAFNPIFEPHNVQITLCNSFIDALSCVLVYACGRLAFDRKTALVAGLLFAFYPAAIINTQHCYSEPFSYFLLNLWTALLLFLLLRHRKGFLSQFAGWCGIGLLSGFLMLSKPAFVLLPFMVALFVLPVAVHGRLSSRTPGQTVGQTIVSLLRKYLLRAGLAVVGAALVLAPWMCFNKAATGQYSVFVNRVPSFNIFHGNQIGTDGWRCYPFYGCFPGDSKLVAASLLADAGKEPVHFIGLQFKKVARLWSGVWNEYHYSLFGVPLPVQSLLHQLILLLAVLSLSCLLFRGRHKSLSRTFSAGLVFGTIGIFHFAYIPFEAISRYAVTFMPVACLLCAFVAVQSWVRPQARKALVWLVLVAIPGFLLISASGSFANLMASVFSCFGSAGGATHGIAPTGQIGVAGQMAGAGQMAAAGQTAGIGQMAAAGQTAGAGQMTLLVQLAPVLVELVNCCVLFVCCLLGIRLLKRIDPGNSKFIWLIPGAFTFLAAIVSGFYTIQSYDWGEWSCSVNGKQSIRQVISIPANFAQSIKKAGEAFLLVDLTSETVAPPIQIRLNGTLSSEEPVPLALLQPNNEDILQCLAIQGEGMGVDSRKFRHWWVVPFPVSCLQTGDNTIDLSCPDDSAGVTVYGDFAGPDKAAETSDGSCYLPSLRSFSYTKGFTTFDHRDTRVFEKIDLRGSTKTGERILTTRSSAGPATFDARDLSESFGCQSGRYRIRIMIAEGIGALAASPELSGNEIDFSGGDFTQDAQVRLVGAERIHSVKGQDPTTFVPEKPTIALPPHLPKGCRFSFSCQSRCVSGMHPYFIGLSFKGLGGNNKSHTWSSKWQPIAISPSRVFRETSFTDIIPAEMLALKDLQIHPLFSPFQPDYLFLKRKQAIKSSVEIRDARLRLLNPLRLPPLESRGWLVF